VASTAIHRPSSIFFPHLTHAFTERLLGLLGRERGFETTDGPLFVRCRDTGIIRFVDPLIEGSSPESLSTVGELGPSSCTVSIGNFPLGRDPVDLDTVRELDLGFKVDGTDEDASDKRAVDVVNVLKRLFPSSGNEGEVYDELDDAVDILLVFLSLCEPDGNLMELAGTEPIDAAGECERFSKDGDGE
jgi:hypothetical protein